MDNPEFPQIKINMPIFPSIIDGEWPINIPSFTSLPSEIKLCISGTPFPPISLTWEPPPTFPPIIFIQSPGTTTQEYLAMKESKGIEPTTEEKCKAILEKIVEICNNEEKIGFEHDWGGFTLTVTKGKMHTHVGIPGKDGNFDILVNNLYDLLAKNKGLSWA